MLTALIKPRMGETEDICHNVKWSLVSSFCMRFKRVLLLCFIPRGNNILYILLLFNDNIYKYMCLVYRLVLDNCWFCLLLLHFPCVSGYTLEIVCSIVFPDTRVPQIGAQRQWKTTTNYMVKTQHTAKKSPVKRPHATLGSAHSKIEPNSSSAQTTHFGRRKNY